MRQKVAKMLREQAVVQTKGGPQFNKALYKKLKANWKATPRPERRKIIEGLTRRKNV